MSDITADVRPFLWIALVTGPAPAATTTRVHQPVCQGLARSASINLQALGGCRAIVRSVGGRLQLVIGCGNWQFAGAGTWEEELKWPDSC